MVMTMLATFVSSLLVSWWYYSTTTCARTLSTCLGDGAVCPSRVCSVPSSCLSTCSAIIELRHDSMVIEQATYRVEVDWAPAYELLVSLKAYLSRPEQKILELGAGW